MNAQVFVETESDFLAWVELKTASPETPTEGIADTQEEVAETTPEPTAATIDGRELFLNLGCGACHVLTDASTTGVLGPNLDNFAEVATTRVIGKDADAYAQESIADPNAFIVEGFPPGIMPQNFGDRLTVEEIEALAAYLLDQ